MRHLSCFLLALAASAALESAARAEAPPRVVATLVPVHSLVAGVMEGVGNPTLLIPGGASPHAYALRPSEVAALEEAQAVFWIGEALETFLEHPLETLASDAETVAFMEVPGIELLSFREGGAWETHDDHDGEAHGDRDEEAHDDHDEEAHGDHGEVDPHVWLDPRNAIVMTGAIAEALGRADPVNAARYDENAAAQIERLEALDANLAATLAPVAGMPYFVFHDAYHYLEKRYGLSAAGSITLSPERAPGARRIAEVRDRIQETGALCVFAEPQFEPRLVATVIEGTGARSATLDPVGAGLAAGREAYFTLLEDLARSLKDCLLGTS